LEGLLKQLRRRNEAVNSPETGRFSTILDGIIASRLPRTAL
jgi:hypothetical protein